MGVHVFCATIYKIGIIRFVDVPPGVSRMIGEGSPHVAVKGEVEGIPLETTLVSRGQGCYRLAIHGDIRKRLRIDAGAVVECAIERDEFSREPVLPPALAFALRNAPKAQAAFRQMSTALRRQIVRYLMRVRQQSTLERRVSKMVRRLEQRKPPVRKPVKSKKRPRK
jgi:Bacteriocin-protection, YdeI or OmpD-Associated/Domain of unknown function (DUF1905)